MDLQLIDLDQQMTGYRQFISCWVGRHEGLTFLVDPGPRASAGHLLGELKRRGVESVDFVLLTHIHLDHGGGSAEVLSAFPGSRLYCHPSGIRHLEDPSRLWKGSLDTIGGIARMYGEPTPVPSDRFVPEEELDRRGIRVIPTPGHAVHHVSFLFGDTLFPGEAIATRLPTLDGRSYQRPATPPRFIQEVFVESLDRLSALEPEPRQTAFAHYGLFGGARELCRQARDQLLVWVDTVREARSGGEIDPVRFFERLQSVDALFGCGRFEALAEDIQVRERFYVENSLRGIRDYLEND